MQALASKMQDLLGHGRCNPALDQTLRSLHQSLSLLHTSLRRGGGLAGKSTQGLMSSSGIGTDSSTKMHLERGQQQDVNS
eukprot:5601893-Amphidinium_carterae.1